MSECQPSEKFHPDEPNVQEFECDLFVWVPVEEVTNE